MASAPRTLAARLGLPPCALHGEATCPRCYTRAPTEAEIAEAVALHAAAELLGVVGAGEAWGTALWWRLHRPRLITLRGLVAELTGALAGGRFPLDCAGGRAFAHRLTDIASLFDRRLREPQAEVSHG